jgi:Phage integrase family
LEAGERGGFLNFNNWRSRVWDAACRAAGVRAVPYDLRHTFASLLIHEGRSMPYVSAALGHASPVMTLNRYSHLFTEASLGTGEEMVAAVQRARAELHESCTLPAVAKGGRRRQPASLLGSGA